jgi:zinc transport system substrate-binding protein
MFTKAALLGIGLLVVTPVLAEPPRVVASITPVQSLVAGVMAGIGSPELLVPGNASPHVYTLRPSDARKLDNAQLVFWVGEIYEGFLEKPLEALAGKAKVVTLSAAEGVTLLRARGGGAWEGDTAHAHGHSHKSGKHDHAAREDDGHLWLDPENAKAIASAAARALSEADPPNAARYGANADALKRRLAELDRTVAARLGPVGKQPYVVFHDAYQYFERRYGLAPAGSITVAPEGKPGANRVQQIRAKMTKLGARCIFAEPQFEPSIVRTIAADTKAKAGVLDGLGADLPEGPDLYFALMERLAGSLADCLASPRS